jgi:protein-tyrosine phosphatase
MDGLVDIHAHILPAIDDGPTNLESALEMARAAVDAGIDTLVATPHLRSDFPDVHLHELAGRCQELNGAIDAEGIPLRIVSGAEISLVWALSASQEELVLASVGQRGTDLLVETPLGTVGGIDQHLYQLRAQGFRITLAHPERSPEFQQDEDMLKALINQEVLLQINGGSLLDGRKRSESGRFARKLCVAGWPHALASDGHRGESWRPVEVLRQGVQAASGLVGSERAQWMARDAPAAIIAGMELPDPPKLRRRRLLGR